MMRPTTALRIARELFIRDSDGMAKRGARQLVEAFARPDARPHARYVVGDLWRYVVSFPRPVRGHAAERAHLAADWLMRAQAVTEDGGLSYGYFPFWRTGGWHPSYPETSGYTVPSLLQYSVTFDRPDAARTALRMASFVVSSQLPSGALYGGTVRPVHERVATSFNTGMGLMGLLAAYRHTRDVAFGAAARRAAEFLVSDISDDGYFRSYGPSVRAHPIKTFACLCAWPLYEAGAELAEPAFCASAIRLSDAALRQQQPNGWFAYNCLSRRLYAPLLHTIAYTLQGLTEVGIASGETRFVDAARRGLEPLLPYCERGFVHGRWFDDWQPAAFSSCLVGAAQTAIVCYRLAEHTGDARYRRAADAVLNLLKGVQRTSSASGVDREFVGALGGSLPLVGAYMPNGYPGWATKFLLDALLCQHALENAAAGVPVAARA
jgi:hypothetical protein